MIGSHAIPCRPLMNPSVELRKTIPYGSEIFASQGYTTGTLDDQVKEFNNDQRIALNADWSFSIMIADASSDPDGRFNLSGNFSQAFAYPGGLYIVAPSVRPAWTFTHETGHIFWAFDEYPGGDSYLQRRGVYNAQNLNAAGNPTAGFVQQPSIMAGGTSFEQAYLQNISTAATLATIGWRDSDGDGIFDVLDVPLEFNGLVRHDASTNQVRIIGNATAVPYLNQNSDGNQSDITLNRVRRLEYRVDGGTWTTLANFDSQSVNLDQAYSVPASFNSLELRFIDTSVGVTSQSINVLQSGSAYYGGGLQGVAYLDGDSSNGFSANEATLVGWTVQVLNQNGTLLTPSFTVAAQNLPVETIVDTAVTGVTMSAPSELDVGRIYILPNATAKTLGWFSFREGKTRDVWNKERDFKADFDTLQRQVSIDVIGASSESVGRLEAFDSSGKLLARVTSNTLAANEKQTLRLAFDDARIASVRVSSQGPGQIKLDQLVGGTLGTTVTNAQGRFAFGGLADGQYTVQVVPPSASFSPAQRSFSVTVSGGAAGIEAGFTSLQSKWQNISNPLNVDALRGVEPIDALLVINALNQFGPKSLTDADIGPPYLDVTGDGELSPIDALQIINFLNSAAAQGEPASSNLQNSAISRSISSGGASAEPEDVFDSAIANSGTPMLTEGVWGVCDSEESEKILMEPESSELFLKMGFQISPGAVDLALLEIFA